MKSIIALALCVAGAAQVYSSCVHSYPGLGLRHPYVYNGVASHASKYQSPDVVPYLKSTSCGGCGSCSSCRAGVYEHGCGGCGSCSSCRAGVYGHGCGGCGTCASCRAGVYEHGCGGCGSCASCKKAYVPACGGCGHCSACKGAHHVEVVYGAEHVY